MAICLIDYNFNIFKGHIYKKEQKYLNEINHLTLNATSNKPFAIDCTNVYKMCPKNS